MTATLRVTVSGATALLIIAGILGCETVGKSSSFGQADRPSRIDQIPNSAPAAPHIAVSDSQSSSTAGYGGTSIAHLRPGRSENRRRSGAFSTPGFPQGGC